jgi:DNA-directed RNA polymerase subunit RPC12/RpoP
MIKHEYVCPCCKYQTTTLRSGMLHYCPYCGTKMRLERYFGVFLEVKDDDVKMVR